MFTTMMNTWHIALHLMYVIIVVSCYNPYGQKVLPQRLFGSGKQATHPPGVVQVNFPSGAKANNGNELTLEEVKNQPELHWPLKGKNEYYTICFIDPEKKSWENYEVKGYLHWLVVNIPGNDVAKGETLSEYKIGSSVLEKIGGNHTYWLLVYKQPWNMDFDDPLNSDRLIFDFQRFAVEYMLLYPQFGNHFWIKYTDVLSFS